MDGRNLDSNTKHSFSRFCISCDGDGDVRAATRPVKEFVPVRIR